MYCENRYCVYNFEDYCTLDEQTLDIQGRCEECLYIPFTDQQLKKAREHYLKQAEREEI